MKYSIHEICNRFCERKKYVNYWAILLLDVLLSIGSSFVTLLFVDNFIVDLTRSTYFIVIAGAFFVSMIVFQTLGVNKNIIRHATIKSIGKMGIAILLKEFFLLGLVVFSSLQLFEHHAFACFLIDFLVTTVVLIGFRVTLVLVYDLAISRYSTSKTRVLVYGTENKSVALKKRMLSSKHYHVVGFVNSDKCLKSYAISELPVYYFKDEQNFVRFVKKYNINGLLFPSHEEARREKDRLVRFCQNNGVKNFVSPPIDVLGDGLKKTVIREIRIEDLLGREEIKINTVELAESFTGKVVLVTGAAGSIGSELCRQLATLGISRLVLFDNAETPMHELRLELERNFPNLKFTPFIGDVRQKERLRMAFVMFHPQVVFHAAAYKHVPLMEENPCEAVRVNVVGSRLVADFCVEYGVEMMVMISTDKAVNPTNVMGASKRLAEIYVQSLGLAMERGKVKGKTRFVTTRFGNVLGSNGSVIPYFRKQIEQGGPVTVTDPRITRFFMTIPEACRLVMEAAMMSTGNQIFVFDMGEPVKIVDLAERMIRLAGYIPGEDIKIKFIGLRPGEKLYEEVLSNEENTIPTGNSKIRVAKVRTYERDEVLWAYDKLAELALAVEVDKTVRLMKRIVQEFKSRNSVYEVLDKIEIK
ncbi:MULTISPECIES: polysaccharide biosynthesis protein [Butyricimonas]|uniref:polysaccharide biosynthesis protein n=1 Tax=Butyricimonas TaxID=574697 RepID=UPI001D05D44E|nr:MULTISPECIES: nucleoside-diphosphate sugar epimerase/dehydratase [Butyricimonas]MCB6974655.1 polysaccharide biosynthesis protein [Butyricimonas synergistica]MCG4521397.1 polysaccharide biosynthesis protein [Butyricimonas sp. DFI.6.44]